MQMGGIYRNQKGRYQKNGYQQFQVSVGWQVGHQKVDREVNFFSDAIFAPQTQHCFPDLLKTQWAVSRIAFSLFNSGRVRPLDL